MTRVTADIVAYLFTKPICSVALSLAAAGFFTGCTVPCEQAYVTDTDAGLWQNPAVIVVPNDDTTALYDLHIFLRSNKRFAADTLPLRISVLTPDSVFYDERFVFTTNQTPVPSSLSSETCAPYRRRVRFARTGDYRMTISPDMAIEGVEAVGIHLVKNE